MRFQKKFGPGRFNRFGSLLDTNGQKTKVDKYILVYGLNKQVF